MKITKTLLLIAALGPFLPIAVWKFLIVLPLISIIIGIAVTVVVYVALYFHWRTVMR